MSGSGQDRIETVIDTTVLDDIRDLMEDDFADLVRRFLEDSADLIDQLDQGIARGDADAVYRAAHTLKSSSAALGALALSDRAKHLEALGRSGVLDGAAAEAAAAHVQFARAKETLEKCLEEGSQPWTPT
ncbi:Hpt domain-containing protein [Thiocapsa roseopersicina]|uniref:Hpt domain-containing protein n=1 Tax=Thiocapsa roseopersicina TaxID=1058 RepID=A0A1H2UCT9_THIRO|nr:Hpt domain-containing protein [Thiocapsa roseopersicina]SDW53992.1 Hpt domain-containing protein [Thiocapsa roseopersicina]